jgi:signal transduction histidine kinase
VQRFTVFGIVVTYEQLIDIHLLGPLIKGIDNPSYYGALGLLISMSVYLARNFAKTSKNLETQLVQVKELSQKTLEQERRAKALEFERHLLEQEQRAREVLEAKNAELERAYGDLKRTQAELVQSEKMAGLGQIVAGVAHEINNPVNFISSALPALERDLHVILQLFDELDQVYELNLPQLSPLLQRVDALAAELDYQAARAAIPQILLAMREGTERTTEIIKSLRIFARHGGSGKAPVDIHAGLEATLTLLQNRFKKGIVVNQNYGNLPQVECDAGQINQVFMNLLTNAADAMSDKGELFITTRQAGEYVEIRVRDTGCGIPDEIKGKIFEPFFTTKQVGSGMGLGLWICYQIVVEGHEGKIEVESDIGVGTEFVITLPIHSKAGHTSP